MNRKPLLDNLLLLIFAVLALLLRVAVSLRFLNLHKPDEVFQTLEQAHRLIYGNGIIPCEFRQGIGFWAFPGILAGVMRITAWMAIETFLGQHLIRAYELPTEVTRSDKTSCSVYHQPTQEVSDQDQSSALYSTLGYSKDRRPDLQQYRQMLATLTPLGVPLLSTTLEGKS